MINQSELLLLHVVASEGFLDRSTDMISLADHKRQEIRYKLEYVFISFI